MGAFKWRGLEYRVLLHSTTWSDRPGVYVFAQPTSNGWKALYVGRTSSFRDRMPNHPRWSEAMRRGATRVHARVVTQEAKRKSIESDLIEALQPPMNVKLR